MIFFMRSPPIPSGDYCLAVVVAFRYHDFFRGELQSATASKAGHMELVQQGVCWAIGFPFFQDQLTNAQLLFQQIYPTLAQPTVHIPKSPSSRVLLDSTNKNNSYPTSKAFQTRHALYSNSGDSTTSCRLQFECRDNTFDMFQK